MPVSCGQALSHYRLIAKIGEGGMGVVYRARDEHLERDVAVKLLAPGLLGDGAARSRFRTEALALSRLNHPNIATVYDFDSVEETDFLVMEYVPGVELTRRLSAGALGEDEIVRLGGQLLEGLAAAHEQGVVHRDLKPGNLRITEDGRLKILDFGLAKLLQPTTATATTQTRTRGIVGTVPYMAPEQVSGDPVDTRTDVYAAGCALYEMATGRRPFAGEDTARLLYAIAHLRPVPPRRLNPSVSPDLEALILKALEKDPSRRYQSATELSEDLRRIGAGLAVEALRHRVGRAWLRATLYAASVVALLAILAVLDLGGLRSRLTGIPPGPRIESLAVLPLDNLSGDPGQDYFADGLTEALTTDLGTTGAIRVIARHSVMKFADTNLPLQEIGRRLGVDALVVGSVTPMAHRVRVTAQLVDAGTEQPLWFDRFERDMTDILQIQGEVATAIARRIEVSLSPETATRLAAPRAVDPAAYREYLRGRHFIAQFTKEGFFSAIDALKRAIATDPEFAEAHASLGYCYFALGQPFGISDELMMPLAREHVARALDLDDSVVEAHLTRGFIRLFRDYDWAGSEASFLRALALNPGHAYARASFAYYLAAMGRLDNAIAEARRAVSLDPLNLTVGAHLAEILWLAGQYEAAAAAANDVLALDRDFPRAYRMLRIVAESTGRFESAIGAHERERSLQGADPADYGGLRAAYEADGPRGYWLWFYENAIKRVDEAAVRAARAAVRTGDADGAIALLEKAYSNREGDVAAIKVFPEFEPLHEDPRFQDLLRRLNLAD